MIRRRALHGFSLLELSVVLMIVSVVMVFGLDIAEAARRTSDRTATLSRLHAVQTALDAYAATNGYLPCPSSRARIPTDGDFGVEQRDPADTTQCLTDGTALRKVGIFPSAYYGTVPTRTLGLPDHFASDAWSNKLLYVVSGQHVGAIGGYAYYDGALAIRSGVRSGTNYIVTTRRTDDDGDGSPDPGPAATYAVVSHGFDGKGAYAQNARTTGVPCGTSVSNDVENCDDDDLVLFDTAFNDGTNIALFFDDYIVWGSNALMRAPTPDGGPGTGCSGRCELWCAPCDTNYAPINPSHLICRRTITSTSPCRALCEYGYPAENIPCP